MKFSFIVYLVTIVLFFTITSIVGSSCAQIGMPTGGKKDTIPPVLVTASPKLKTVNFNDNKITLTFNEYIEVKDAQINVLVSPFPKKTPEVSYKLKTVTLKLKDTLQPNTTYSINFGKAIIDLNEGNPLGNFTYVFSTGSTIDSLTLSGKVTLAESGKIDSTMLVLLYRNATDSTVQKNKPNYIAKLDGQGNFTFYNLPKDNFKIYALKDGDGGKTYNSKTELFAFLNSDISTTNQNDSIILNAFVQEKEKEKTTPTKNIEKKLRYILTQGTVQDLLTPLTIEFNKPLKKAILTKLLLTDTNYNVIKGTTILLDSTSKKITLTNQWKEEQFFKLIIDKDALADSADLALLKSDTLKITTKKQSDYGNLVLRFKNLDATKNIVLQFVQNDEVKQFFAISSAEWSNKLFPPGEYDLRILYDANKNGKWDTGNYSKKIQPEKVTNLSQKLSIKANWDNERDIEL
jgi:hypothetical protein